MLASSALVLAVGRRAAAQNSSLLSVPWLEPPRRYPRYEAAFAAVTPMAGFQSRIKLGTSIVKLIENGVIDPQKFTALDRRFAHVPAELARVLSEPAELPLLLSAPSAPYLVNLLWPVGLATRMLGNFSSPLNGVDRYGFASTGGWTLGTEPNGGVYFNQFPIIELSYEQEAQVVRIAKATYRPCCNNSTFFQDCNHGSALLGLLELGASQGLADDELYREALAFNSFWFPDYYVQTALYFELFENTKWKDVDPRRALSRDYSTSSGWRANVATPLAGIPDLIPGGGSGVNC